MATLYQLKEEIIQKNDIVELVGEYVKLKRAGSTYAGKCPFHNDKSPSFYVWPRSQSFFCFGCKKGGDVISFLMEIEKITFKEALSLLAKRQNIQYEEYDDPTIARNKKVAESLYELNRQAAIYFFNNLRNKGRYVQKYISERKLMPETVVKFGLGYSLPNDNLYAFFKRKNFADEVILKSGLISTKNKSDIFRGRLMFPIFNEVGKIIAFGGRTLGNDNPKYLNTIENEIFNKRRNLYGINYAKHSKLGGIILVEGYMDVISLNQSGIDNVCASLGTALTVQQVNLLKRYSKDITICYDSDNAGKMAAYRATDLIYNEELALKVFSVPSGKDPDEFVKAHGKEEFLNSLSNMSIDAIEFKMEYLKQKYDLSKEADKALYLDEVLVEVLDKIDSKIKQEIYMKKIKDEFNISIDALHQKINILNSKKQLLQVNKPEGVNEIDNINNCEKYILRILIENSSSFNHVKENLKEEYFLDADFKIIYGIISEIIQQNKIISAETIRSKIPEESYLKVSEKLAVIMNFDFLDSNYNIDKAIDEILLKINKDFLERELKKASRNSDWDAMKNLGRKLTELNNYFSRKE